MDTNGAKPHEGDEALCAALDLLVAFHKAKGFVVSILRTGATGPLIIVTEDPEWILLLNALIEKAGKTAAAGPSVPPS
jgi:hypothetical protein